MLVFCVHAHSNMSSMHGSCLRAASMITMMDEGGGTLLRAVACECSAALCL